MRTRTTALLVAPRPAKRESAGEWFDALAPKLARARSCDAATSAKAKRFSCRAAQCFPQCVRPTRLAAKRRRRGVRPLEGKPLGFPQYAGYLCQPRLISAAIRGLLVPTSVDLRPRLISGPVDLRPLEEKPLGFPQYGGYFISLTEKDVRIRRNGASFSIRKGGTHVVWLIEFESANRSKGNVPGGRVDGFSCAWWRLRFPAAAKR